MEMVRRGEPGVDLARQRFDELVHHHHAALHAYVRVVYPDAHADAVVNSTFVQLWQHLDDVADHSVRAWLRASARHEVLNSNRRDRRWYATTDRAARMATNLPQAPPDLDPTVELAVVMAALGTLGHADREVVLMTALEELTSTELAEILGVRPDAARRRLSRARSRLRDAVQQHRPPAGEWGSAR
jgi:RNA polymerase sigma-70 factor (ECF subfamily)